MSNKTCITEVYDIQDGGAITKSGKLANYSYKTILDKDSITINHSDINFLASIIDNRYVETSQEEIDILALKFYKLFYKTIYHLIVSTVEINIDDTSKPIIFFKESVNNIIFNTNITENNEKIKQQVKNSQFVKSSKYEDNIITETNTPAKYLTQHCFKSYIKSKKQNSSKKLLSKKGYFGKKGFFGSKFNKKQINFNVKDDMKKLFISDDMIQEIPDDISSNHLKCILYYIRYHQIAFNYYLEQLIDVYLKLIRKQDKINQLFSVFGEEKEKEIIAELNNNKYNELSSLIKNKKYEVTGKLETELINSKTSTYSKIMDYINGNNNDFNGYGINITKVETVYKYIFILITYYSKKFITPIFFNKSHKLKDTKIFNGLNSEKTKLLRVSLLIGSIPNCMKIIFGYIDIYKNKIESLKDSIGINHLGGITPNIYKIKKVFSNLSSKQKIEKKLESTEDRYILNKLLLASFIVDKLIFKTFGYLLYDNDKYNNNLANLYNRLLKSKFNEKDSTKIKLPDLETELKKLLESNNVKGVEGITKEISELYMKNDFTDDNDRNDNLNECFSGLYDNVIRVLLSNPIIIHKRNWKDIKKISGEANQDIGNISKDIIKTITNLLISIELGIYDYENNITFRSNYESVYSSLPLYYENIIKQKLGINTEYLLSNKMYSDIKNINDDYPNLKIDSNTSSITSIETSLLSLEEIINIIYSSNVLVFKPNQDVLTKRGEIDRKLLYYTKEDKTQSGGELSVFGKIGLGPPAYLGISVLCALSVGVAVAGSPVAFIPGLFKGQEKTYKGFLSIIPKTANLFNKFNINVSKIKDTELRALSKLLTNKKNLSLKDFKEKYNISNNDIDENEIAKLLLDKFNLSMLYDLAFINNSEENNAAADNKELRKLARNLLIYIITNKILFMTDRLKQLMEATPKYNEYYTTTYNISAYKKLYKLTLSKTMIMFKLKQYLTDLMQITGKIKLADKLGNNVVDITNYKKKLETFAANYIINNFAYSDINNKLMQPAFNAFVNIGDRVYFKDIFGLLSEKTKKILKLDTSKELSDKEKLDEKLREALLIRDLLNKDININLSNEYERLNNNKIKITEIAGNINKLVEQAAANPIKTAYNHFLTKNNTPAFRASNAIPANSYADNSGDRTHYWYFSVINNITKINEYFMGVPAVGGAAAIDSVFNNNDTKDTDPVLLYRINMLILEKYNESMKKCFDNYFALSTRGFKTFITEGNKNEDIATNLYNVLKYLVQYINNLLTGANGMPGVAIGAINVPAADFHKDVCEKLSKYYLVVSLIRNIEYIFQKLNEANEQFLSKCNYEASSMLTEITNIKTNKDNGVTTAANAAAAAAGGAANTGDLDTAKTKFYAAVAAYMEAEINRIIQANVNNPKIVVKHITDIGLTIKEYMTQCYTAVYNVNSSINNGVGGGVAATGADIDELVNAGKGDATAPGPPPGAAALAAAAVGPAAYNQEALKNFQNVADLTSNPVANVNFAAGIAGVDDIKTQLGLFADALGVLHGNSAGAAAAAAAALVPVDGLNYTPVAVARNINDTFENEYKSILDGVSGVIDEIFEKVGDYVKGILPARSTGNIQTTAKPGVAIGFNSYPLDSLMDLISNIAGVPGYKDYGVSININIISEIEKAAFGEVLNYTIYNMNDAAAGLNLQNILHYTKYIYPSIQSDDKQKIVFMNNAPGAQNIEAIDISNIQEPQKSYEEYRNEMKNYLESILKQGEDKLNEVDRFNILHMINYIPYLDIDNKNKSIRTSLKYNKDNPSESTNYNLSDGGGGTVNITNKVNQEILLKVSDIEQIEEVDLFKYKQMGGLSFKTKKNCMKKKIGSTKKMVKVSKKKKTKKSAKKYSKTVKRR
jgi:hypothetical protein